MEKTMEHTGAMPQPSTGSAWEVLGVSTCLGLTSFGGPIAHLGYFHAEYVVRRRWLDEFRFHLSEMHKGVASAAGHGTTATYQATTGVRGPEPLLEPRYGLAQVGYQISNVLNLVKHHLSFAYRVYDANVRRIIDSFSLGPNPSPRLLQLPTGAISRP